MPSFSVAPGAFPPAVPEDFPDFLRWQDEGTYLDSSRTIDTVNLTGAGIQDVSVGGGGTVLTITLGGGPPPSIYPGWMTDIADPDTTPLFANNGIGVMYFGYFGDPPTAEGTLYAGVEGYVSGVVVWDSVWTPTDTDPSPTLTPLSGGRVQIDYRDVPDFPYNLHNDGLLVLSVTVDGVPGAGTIEVATGPNQLYYPLAWQPTP